MKIDNLYYKLLNTGKIPMINVYGSLNNFCIVQFSVRDSYKYKNTLTSDVLKY